MGKVVTQKEQKSILLEALRWAASLPAPRMVHEDCEIGPYTLLAGNFIIIDSRSLQMDPNTWQILSVPESAPENFWSERFLDGDDESEANCVDEAYEAETAYAAEVISSICSEKLAPKIKTVEPISGSKSKDIQQRILALRPFSGGITLWPGRHFSTNEIFGAWQRRC
jgi:cytochrome P450